MSDQNPFSEDLKDMLEAESSLGLDFGTNLFIGSEPPAPDQVVTIYDTGGYPGAANYDLRRPAAQVRVRSNNYRDGWVLANAVLNALHGKHEETWNGTRYLQILAASDVLYLGKDEQGGRFLFTANFQSQRTMEA